MQALEARQNPGLSFRVLAVWVCLSCVVSTASATASEIDETVAALRAVSIGEDNNTDVPPAIVTFEARFKRLLREEAVRVLPDVDAAQVDLASVKPALDALAQRYAPVDNSDQAYRSGAIYGNVLRIQAERPGRADLIAIVTQVRVGCGQDTSLALMAHREGRWVEVLDIDAGAIRSIDQAFDLFEYRVLSPRADGSYLVVDAHVTPWCQSNWRTLKHAVHRVSRRAPARRIFESTQSITLGVDDPVYAIRLRRTGYSLHFTAEGPHGDPASWRTQTVDFDIRAGHVRRGRTHIDPGQVL